MILAIICAGLLAGVVYTVTKGKSGTQKKQEASAEAGADETESQSGIIGEDGKRETFTHSPLSTGIIAVKLCIGRDCARTSIRL